MFSEAICMSNHTIYPCVGKKFGQVMHFTVSVLIKGSNIISIHKHSQGPEGSVENRLFYEKKSGKIDFTHILAKVYILRHLPVTILLQPTEWNTP